MTNEIAVKPDAPLSAIEIKTQVQLIQRVMQSVMQNNQHYGTVPGCGNKPTLLKPGAEKLALTFKLRPVMENERDIVITELQNGHRDYNVYCHILNSQGVELATGIGSCSTMESKYRYRNAVDYEITGEKIPTDAKERKAEYRKAGHGMKQVDGQWHWVKYTSTEKTENPDIADVYNTVLKMAKKRAFIDGILSATGASDIFTQDIEDMPAETLNKTAPKKAAEKPSTPKPISETSKISGINEKFIDAKAGKKSCAIVIDGNFYLANVKDTDTKEIMQSTVGQEIEISFSTESFKGKDYHWIKEIIPITSIEPEVTGEESL